MPLWAMYRKKHKRTVVFTRRRRFPVRRVARQEIQQIPLWHGIRSGLQFLVNRTTTTTRNTQHLRLQRLSFNAETVGLYRSPTTTRTLNDTDRIRRRLHPDELRINDTTTTNYIHHHRRSQFNSNTIEPNPSPLFTFGKQQTRHGANTGGPMLHLQRVERDSKPNERPSLVKKIDNDEPMIKIHRIESDVQAKLETTMNFLDDSNDPKFDAKNPKISIDRSDRNSPINPPVHFLKDNSSTHLRGPKNQSMDSPKNICQSKQIDRTTRRSIFRNTSIWPIEIRRRSRRSTHSKTWIQ